MSDGALASSDLANRAYPERYGTVGSAFGRTTPPYRAPGGRRRAVGARHERSERIGTLTVVWDTVFVVVVGALWAMVFVIAVLSLIVLPAVLVSSWIGRRSGRLDHRGSRPDGT